MYYISIVIVSVILYLLGVPLVYIGQGFLYYLAVIAVFDFGFVCGSTSGLQGAFKVLEPESLPSIEKYTNERLGDKMTQIFLTFLSISVLYFSFSEKSVDWFLLVPGVAGLVYSHYLGERWLNDIRKTSLSGDKKRSSSRSRKNLREQKITKRMSEDLRSEDSD